MPTPLLKVKSGFTMVEILVVVGILMLLAGLLFPVLSRARENGKRTVCMSNLKQIALGIQQYVQDNSRRYPPLAQYDSSTGLPVDGTSFGWAYTVANRVKSDQIFQCPSEADKTGFTDYWMNADIMALSEVRLNQPANVILNGEGASNAADYILGSAESLPDWEAWDPEAEYTARHLGGANYSFADGHVKFLKPTQITPAAPANGSNFTFTP